LTLHRLYSQGSEGGQIRVSGKELETRRAALPYRQRFRESPCSHIIRKRGLTDIIIVQKTDKIVGQVKAFDVKALEPILKRGKRINGHDGG